MARMSASCVFTPSCVPSAFYIVGKLIFCNQSAQAIMEDPSILILDEPFNGLDKQGVADIHALLQNLKVKGKCILLASHSGADIEKACDTIYAMENGQLHLIKSKYKCYKIFPKNAENSATKKDAIASIYMKRKSNDLL